MDDADAAMDAMEKGMQNINTSMWILENRVGIIEDYCPEERLEQLEERVKRLEQLLVP